MDTKKAIVTEYREKKQLFREVDSIATEMVEHCLKENQFFCFGIMHRIKNEKSLSGKLERYPNRFSSLIQMTDVIGLRIICYLSDDIDGISDAIQKLFTVVEIRDKRQKANVSEFGYASLHLLCRLKPEDGYSADLCSVTFEIQIRTVLQHAWAEIEHDMDYKSEYALPSKLTRAFSRVAGLLEIADEQFCDLKGKINEYTDEITHSIETDCADDLTINYITLNRYMTSSQFILGILDELSEKLGIEIIHSDLSYYIDQLNCLNITTLGELRKLIDRNKMMVDALIDTESKKHDLDIFTDAAILRITMAAELIASDYTREMLVSFYKLRSFDDDKAGRHADWILRQRSDQNHI